MVARIYRSSKTAMQSGQAGTKDWILGFEPEGARIPDPLMGWSSSSDMDSQICLHFETEAEAVTYAKSQGLVFQVKNPKPRKRILRAYADNFAFGRKEPWTH